MSKQPALTYSKLKADFREMGEDEFSVRYRTSLTLKLSAIKAIAVARNDNGWPLEMLKALNHELSDALSAWTAGGYEGIRKAQKTGIVAPGSTADKLQRNFENLPLWKGHVTHASKASTLYEQLKSREGFELQAFMSCCAHSY